MNTDYFPSEIRDYFLSQTDEKNDQKYLGNLFKNEVVREAFVDWAIAHSSVVYHTPRLYKALDLAQHKALDVTNEDYLEWNEIASTINDIYHWFINDGSASLIRKIIDDKNPTITNIPPNFFQESCELFETGLINQQSFLKLVSTKNKAGDLIFYNEDLYLLGKLDSDTLYKFFSIQDNDGETVLFYKSLDGLLPFLEKLDSESLSKVVSMQNLLGNTALFYKKGFKKIFPLLKKIDPESLLKIFSIRNKEGEFILQQSSVYKKSLTFFDKFSPDILIKIFAIQDKDGHPLLHFANLLEITLPFLEKLEPETLVKIFSIQNRKGNPLLFYPKLLKISLPFLEKLDSETLVKIFSIQNNQGESLLFYNSEKLLHLLEKLDVESLNQLMSIKNYSGDTPLHELYQQLSTSPLMSKIKPEFFQIRNNNGFIPGEWERLQISDVWLAKDKMTVNLKSLSIEEYQTKAKELKKDIEELWNSFVFGGEEEGNISNEYLLLKIEDSHEIFSPADIKKNLLVMVDKMLAKTSWLGTPPQEKPEALHLFYSQMLSNFEQIVTHLKNEENPAKKAGSLISIAKVEIEGRCAAAYQAEIEQTLMILDSNMQGSSVEATFQKQAQTLLITTIESIVRNYYEADSHAFTHMLYSVGLSPSPDPLSNVSVQESQEIVTNAWTKNVVTYHFLDSAQELSQELLEEWFKADMPDDYGEEFLIKKNEIHLQEQKIVNHTKAFLESQGLETSLIDSAIQIFQSTKGADLRVISTKRSEVSEAVYEKFQNALTLEDVNKAEEMQQADNSLTRERLGEIRTAKEELAGSSKEEDIMTLKKLQEEQRTIQQKNMKSGIEFRTLKLAATNKIELHKLLQATQETPVSNKDLQIFLDAKRSFDQNIALLAEGREIDFTPSENGLPSRAIESQRRSDYAKQFFTVDKKLKMNGAANILKRIGVLETI